MALAKSGIALGCEGSVVDWLFFWDKMNKGEIAGVIEFQ